MRSANLSALAHYGFALVVLTTALADPTSAQISGDQQNPVTEKGGEQDKDRAPAAAGPKCDFEVKKHTACPTGQADKRKCPGDRDWVFLRCR